MWPGLSLSATLPLPCFLDTHSLVGSPGFCLLAFHPYIISIFDRALAETFLTVISAAVLGAGIELWNCRDEGSVFRRRIAFIVFAAGFAIAHHTRKEGIVLLAPLHTSLLVLV